jgi:large conductance mechanosensitive channel
MWTEFRTFLVKDNVIGLAIAFILGATLNKLVGSVVDDLIMPLVSFVMPPNTSWQEFTVPPGNEKGIRLGAFLAALLNFFIIGFVCWRISKIFIKPKPAA